MVTYWASKDDSDTLFQSYTRVQNDSCTGKIFIVKSSVIEKKWEQLSINWMPVKCILICMCIPTHGFVFKYIDYVWKYIHTHKKNWVQCLHSEGGTETERGLIFHCIFFSMFLCTTTL